MEIILTIILGFIIVCYGAVIVFYIENIGFLRELTGSKIKILIGVSLVALTIDVIFVMGGVMMPLAMLTFFLIWIFLRKNYLEDLINFLIFCFGLITVMNFISESFINLLSGFQVKGIAVLFVVVVLIAIMMHVKLKGKLDKRLYDSPNLKFTLLACGSTILLFQSQLGITYSIVPGMALLLDNQMLLFILLFIFLGILAYINVVHTNRQLLIEKERAEAAAFEQYTEKLEASYDAL